MELDPTEEQTMLAETVNDLLDKRYDANTRLALIEDGPGWSRDMWRQYAQLGLLGLPFDERYGGAGQGVEELAVVLECFGRTLVLEPYLPTVVLGGGLVDTHGTAEQRAQLLPAVCSGDLLLAFGYAEPGSRWSLTELDTRAEPDPADTSGDTWLLTGEKIDMLGGADADKIIVTAATTDGRYGLFVIDTEAAGLARDEYARQDGLRGADLRLDSTPAVALGTLGDGALAAVESVLDVALTLLCAEAVGAMDRMLWMTVDYLKTREQFGRPIATFQALQHRAANMYVSLELARGMAQLARLALSDEDVVERRRVVRAAKVQIDTSARHIGQEAIQLHGGIGMTMEYPVGHYVKRTAVIAKTFADTDLLIEQVGAGDGLIPA